MSTNGIRKYLLMAALMLAGTLTAGAQRNYVFHNATYGYIINNNGNPGVSTTFTTAAIWVANNTLGTTGRSLYSYTDNSKYLNGGNNANLSLGNSQSSWQTRNGYLTYRPGNTNYYVIYYNGNLLSYNYQGDRFTPYEVTITPLAATLTGVTIATGESTLMATGEYLYTLSDGSYTNASTNYYFNGANHYYPAQTTTTVTPEGTWSVTGTGASYVSVDENTGTITVNSLPTDGDKTITLRCVPTYGGATATAVTKNITLKARCQTPTFSFNNSNNQVTISSATGGATIYYTTDGSEPTTSSTQYNGAFTQATGATIKAIAVKDGMGNSEVGEYELVKLAMPYARNNAAGNAVTFESPDDGVTFYYTSGNYDANGDFAAPTTSSTAWHTGDAAVSITTEYVVKVIAAKSATATTGYITSDVYVRRVNATDMSERPMVIMYNAGTTVNPEVHFLANSGGIIQNTTTFDPSTCIWEALPFAFPNASAAAASLIGSDMKYEPFIRFRNNGRYLTLHVDAVDHTTPQGWDDWMILSSSEPEHGMYFVQQYLSAERGTIIGAVQIDVTQQVVATAASFQLGYNNGNWRRYTVSSGLALYNNPFFAVYYPVEMLGGADYLLNVNYPANYELVKEEVNKGESITITSSITGSDGTGTGTYGLPYYRVGNEADGYHYYYYPNTYTPLDAEPSSTDDIRITYQLLNGEAYLDVDDATHTYTLVRDPGRDLYVTVRITATPWIDTDDDGIKEPIHDGAQVKDYQFHILTQPPFPAPVISRVEGTNDYQMDCSASNAIIEYQINGSSDCDDFGDVVSSYHSGWCLYDGPITVTNVGTIITARSYRNSDLMMSDPVEYKVGGAMLLPPIITIDEDGNVTITANPSNSSLPGYTSERILYTINGSIPDPENYGGNNPTQEYSAGFTVDNGRTVTAIATALGFTNSAPTAETYKVISGVNIAAGVITLNDYEDHNWSYYQASADLPTGYPDALHSPYPRNVQITYYGYGDNTMSTADAAAPDANTFNKNTTPVDVQVGIGEAGHTFLYYKTLERDANGRYPYELIPNPFYVRPDYRSGITAEHKIKVTMNDASGNGWNGQLLADFSGDDRETEVFQLASGSTGEKVITVNAGVKVRLTWVEGNDNSDVSFTVRYYDNNTNGDIIYSVSAGDITTSAALTTFTVKGLSDPTYTGFYKWRVKSITNGSIYAASSGGTALATTSTTSTNNVMLDAETTYYFVPSDAGTTNANNATSMQVELEALWALAEVTTGTSFSKGYNSVERNFSVGRSGTSNNVFGSSTPCTYSSFYPNGTTNGTTAATLANRNSMGIGNPSAASKLEYYIISGNTSSMNAGGRNITIGRGVEASGTYVAQNVYGANANATTLNYRLRLESGSYQNFYLTGQGRTYSGVVTAKAIFGSDYDRAKEDNSKLAIAASSGSIYGGTTLTFSGTGNRNNMTFDWNIKSGTFHSGITGNASGGDQSIYLGSSQSGSGNLQYIGKRRIIVEGGEMAGIAGAMNNVSTNYGVNDGGWAVMVRVKGGTIRTSIYGAAAFAQAVGDRVMILTGGTVNGWIAGGCNGTQTGSGGTVNGDTKIYVGGNTKVKHTDADPTISTSKGGNVFGAGSGYSADYEIGEVNNSNVVVADSAEISRGVYGGGNFGYVGTGYTTNMFILGGKMANVFGGANQRFGQTVNITMTGGLVTDGLYGGSNVSGNINNNVTIKINGGQIGVDADHLGYVHGGGLGNATRVLGSVNMTIGESVGAENYVTIYGDVYGGSAQGRTNGNNSRTDNAVTNVTLNEGKIHGSLYGGGLGTNDYAAHVYGPVQVTVNGGGIHATHQDGSGAVYGCNNVNGAPQSTVNVDIYGTDAPADGREYALDAVYGGGNKAGYTGTPVVKVHNCDNSIEYVYGGGNAADVAGTNVTIYGGDSIGYVFAGGNGTVSDANVTGNVLLNIHGGVIRHVFGGNNTSGTIGGTITVNVAKQTEDGHASCPMKIGEVFSGGNMANSQAGSITIGCTGDFVEATGSDRYGYELEGIGDVYGGANAADVTGNISLTINGGIINRVFGGNNFSGDIIGTINVIINKTQGCGWYVGYVYGGGNQAAYTAPSVGYPNVSVQNGKVTYDVYGGGFGDPVDDSQGKITGSTYVEIINHGIVGRNVFGGGNAAAVTGDTDVRLLGRARVYGNVYGGGNQGEIGGDTKVIVNGL